MQEFNRRFRHEMCAMLVRQKVDADAGDVIAAMLQLSRPHETRLQEDRSAPLAEAAITALVAKSASKGIWHVQPASVPGKWVLCVISLFFALTLALLHCRCSSPTCRGHIRGATSLQPYAVCVPDGSSFVQLVTCVGEAHGGASYCVNMKRIVDLIRMKEVCWIAPCVRTPSCL